MEKLLKVKEAVEMLGVNPRTSRAWRFYGQAWQRGSGYGSSSGRSTWRSSSRGHISQPETKP